MARARKSEAEQAGVLVWGKITATLAEALVPLTIVRILGKGEVGAVIGLLLIYRTLAQLIAAGFPAATLYFLANRSSEDRKAIMRRLNLIMVVLAAMVAVLMALIGWFGADVLAAFGQRLAGDDRSQDDELVKSLRYLPLLGLYAFFDMPSRLSSNMLLSEERPAASAGFGIVFSLTNTVATLVPAALGFGVGGIVAFTVLGGVGPLGYHLLWVRRLYGKTQVGTSPHLRELIKISIPLGITDVVNMLNTRLDLWLVVALFLDEDVAVYQAGAFQIPIITTIAYSLGSVYLPRFKKLHEEGKNREAVDLWRMSIGKVSLVVVPLAMAFFVAAEEFIGLGFTEEYMGAAPIFRLYTLLTMARVTAFGSFMVAAGKPGYVLRSAAMTLISNALISIPLVLMMRDLQAPAMGTVIAFVPTVAFYCWHIGKAWEVKFSQTFPLWVWLRVVIVAAIPGGLIYWGKLQLDAPTWLIFVGEIVGVLVGYAILGTLFRLISREDWAFAWSWAKLRVLKNEDT